MESKFRILLDLIINNRFFILGYHSIMDDPADVWSIHPNNFAAQMEFLAQKKIRVRSLDYCVDQLRQGKAPGNAVVITFDDGYLNFLQNAVPILQKHHFPATVFIPVNLIGRKSNWCNQQLQRGIMGWSDLKEILQLGFAVGSHSLSHTELTSLDPTELTREVFESKKILEDQLGKPVTSFAAPFALCGTREITEIERAGYRCNCGPVKLDGNGPKTNRFMLGRTFVKNFTSLQDVSNQINGFSIFMNRVKSRLSK